MLAVKKQQRQRRRARIKSKIFTSQDKPRLCVFRSNQHIYSQLIDDNRGHTLASASDHQVKPTSHKKYQGKIAKAYEVGLDIGQKAIAQKIKKVVFDRGGFKYHGRVKALAEGARQAGLEF
ncbi:MAG: 50S ribosomal protein L18 [Patescibacteria group bacterium]